MKSNQFLVAILCATAITGGAFVGSISSAQACWRLSQLNATKAVGQSPQPFNPTTTDKDKSALGIALLAGLLAVGGFYVWSRRSRHSDAVVDEADSQVIEVPSTPVVEQLELERELVGSRN